MFLLQKRVTFGVAFHVLAHYPLTTNNIFLQGELIHLHLPTHPLPTLGLAQTLPLIMLLLDHPRTQQLIHRLALHLLTIIPHPILILLLQQVILRGQDCHHGQNDHDHAYNDGLYAGEEKVVHLVLEVGEV